MPASSARTCGRQLLKMLDEQKEVTRKLRALWALHVTGPLDEKTLLGLLDSPHEAIRSWAVRLLVEDKRISDDAAKRLAESAQSDKAASVRLALASALQRLPLGQRWAIAEALAGHAEDATDDNLPLMIWYGIEPLVPADPDRAAQLLAKCGFRWCVNTSLAASRRRPSDDTDSRRTAGVAGWWDARRNESMKDGKGTLPMAVIKCPECGKSLKVSDSIAGKRLRCPGCKNPFVVPEDAPVLELVKKRKRNKRSV